MDFLFTSLESTSHKMSSRNVIGGRARIRLCANKIRRSESSSRYVGILREKVIVVNLSDSKLKESV